MKEQRSSSLELDEVIDMGNRADVQKLIIFLHIPKAGGTTINGIINQQYSKKSVIRFDGINNLNCLSQMELSQRSQLKLIRGHFAFGLHNFLSCHSTYFTLLRNPVSRVISHYNYLCRSYTLPKYEQVKSMSLKEYLLSDLSINNLMTKMLFGLSDIPVTGDNEILETAKYNLQTYFSVVGLVERFDETLLLLQKSFNWRFTLYVRQNITSRQQKSKNVLDPDIIKLICDQNYLDMELYEYAQQCFTQNIAKFNEDFTNSLARQKILNQFYQLFGIPYNLARSFLNKGK